jgi:hypothetical protein
MGGCLSWLTKGVSQIYFVRSENICGEKTGWHEDERDEAAPPSEILDLEVEGRRGGMLP